MEFQTSTDEFLAYLQFEKNCSEHTIRAYAYDLA
jgi:site-specific recombinase XerD